MKVGDIYYQQMEKPDRDYNNAQDAEKEYRTMINMFPDSPLIPRAKQKLRDVQEVLAERETQIGLYYEKRITSLPDRTPFRRWLTPTLYTPRARSGRCWRSAMLTRVKPTRSRLRRVSMALCGSACTPCMKTKRQLHMPG